MRTLATAAAAGLLLGLPAWGAVTNTQTNAEVDTIVTTAAPAQTVNIIPPG